MAETVFGPFTTKGLLEGLGDWQEATNGNPLGLATSLPLVTQLPLPEVPSDTWSAGLGVATENNSNFFPAIKETREYFLAEEIDIITGGHSLTGNKLSGDPTALDLLFLDSDLKINAEKIAQRARDGGDNLIIAELNQEQSLVEQITSTLLKYQDGSIRDVHLVAHGSPGAIRLGDKKTTLETLIQDSNLIRNWGQKFGSDSDIFLYGCNISEGDSGNAFISQLASLSGTDVAASSDVTGPIAQGFNLRLEDATGTVDSQFDPSWLSLDGVIGLDGVTDASANTYQVSAEATRLELSVTSYDGAKVGLIKTFNHLGGAIDLGTRFNNFPAFTIDASSTNGITPRTAAITITIASSLQDIRTSNSQINIRTGAGNDSFDFSGLGSTADASVLVLNAGTGSDQLLLRSSSGTENNIADTVEITGTGSGSINGLGIFSGFESLLTGSGDDIVKVSANGSALAVDLGTGSDGISGPSLTTAIASFSALPGNSITFAANPATGDTLARVGGWAGVQAGHYLSISGVSILKTSRLLACYGASSKLMAPH